MSRTFVIVGAICILSVALAADLREERESGKGKETEKKPIIIKDYICLREGDLCHPDYTRSRSKYITCSHGVAYEQECPKCGYHPLTCPTKQLWFDGEKGHCEWASPALASQPCVDRFSIPNNANTTRDEMLESESLLHTLNNLQQSGPMQMPMQAVPAPVLNPINDPMDVNKWAVNNGAAVNGQMFYGDFKSPKSVKLDHHENHQETENHLESAEQEVLEQEQLPLQQANVEENVPAAAEEPELAPSKESSVEEENMDEEEKDGDISSYLDDSNPGSKIVRLNEPVYTLVPDRSGSGKKILKRVSEAYIFENQARSLIPNINRLTHYSEKS